MKKLSLPPTERRRLARNQIYQYIYKAPGCSKQEIADSLNFSMPTVHQNLNELTQAGLVRIDGVGESTGGRRPLQLTINENAHFFCRNFCHLRSFSDHCCEPPAR